MLIARAASHEVLPDARIHSSGCRHAHPVRTTYKIASTIARRGCFSGWPPALTCGSSGASDLDSYRGVVAQDGNGRRVLISILPGDEKPPLVGVPQEPETGVSVASPGRCRGCRRGWPACASAYVLGRAEAFSISSRPGLSGRCRPGGACCLGSAAATRLLERLLEPGKSCCRWWWCSRCADTKSPRQ